MKFSFAGLILLIGLFGTANLATAQSIETDKTINFDTSNVKLPVILQQYPPKCSNPRC